MTLTTDRAVQAQTILQRSVCLLLTCGYVGNHRAVDANTLGIRKGEDELTDEKKVLSISKRLVEAEAVRACAHTINSAKHYLRSVAASGLRVFGPGTYLVPMGLVEEVESRLATYRVDLATHAEALAAQWPQILAVARDRHGKLFEPSDFPTADEVRAAWQLDWSYVSFDAPDQLVEVSQAAYEAAKQKFQGKCADAYEEYVSATRQAALMVLRELATRLAPGKDGKPKALRATALDDLRDLLARLPLLNIADDEWLADIMARVGALSTGIDVEALRKIPSVRGMLLQTAEEAIAQLDQLVSTGPRAMILA